MTAPGVSAAALAAADSIEVGGHTLVLEQVELVLREIELKRVHDGQCDDDRGGSSPSAGSASRDDDDHDDDACEKFVTGPMLLDLPLGEGPERVVTIEADTGTYREVEFEIHKPEDDPGDDAFLAAHPDLKKVSIRARGRFDGVEFTYLSDLSAEQEYDLVPPLVVSEATTTNLTLTIDVTSWFKVGGQLVDPGQANKGAAFENAVRDNIRRSIRLFEDRDHDGRDDHD
ncbi:MAG: hypothetical protein R2909_12440 [Gemmatimonadales bacterium]